MRIEIDKIVYPGKSLAKPEGKIVLLDEGLPGEVVDAELIKERKNYNEARVVQVVHPSPHRIEPRCGHYKICAPYQYIDYATQVRIKKTQIEEIFLRQLKTEWKDGVFRAAEKHWGYRNKVRLCVVWEKDTPSPAYHLPGTRRRYAVIDECFLASEQVNRLLRSLMRVLANHRLRNIEEITVRENTERDQLAVILHCTSLKNLELFRKEFDILQKSFPLKGILCFNKNTSEGYLIEGIDFIREKVSGRFFCIGPESFFQINVPLLGHLIKDLKSAVPLKKDFVLADLYCGVGTFGIILAQYFGKVIAVESSGENIPFLKMNIGENAVKNITVRRGDCKKKIDEVLKSSVDVLIVDPPRAGLDPTVCSRILKNPPRTIAYISCDPTTLARDLKILLSAYRIQRLFAYDFFPQTPHIETLTILSCQAGGES